MLRHAREDDLRAVDGLTVECYRPIFESYRCVLDHFREQGLRFAHVDTGLDDAHIPARRAYEATGFDRVVPTVEYWQDLSRRNPGSTLA